MLAFLSLPVVTFNFILRTSGRPDSVILRQIFTEFLKEMFSQATGTYSFLSDIEYAAVGSITTITLSGNWTGDTFEAPSRADYKKFWGDTTTQELLIEKLVDAGYEPKQLTVDLTGKVAAQANIEKGQQEMRKDGLADSVAVAIQSFAVFFLLVPWAVVTVFVARKNVNPENKDAILEKERDTEGPGLGVFN